MSHWASVRSFGCFIYFEHDHPVPARALLEALVTGMGVEPELKISTKNYFLRWRKFSWKVIDRVIADGETLSITVMVGAPHDVRLGGWVTLRRDAALDRACRTVPRDPRLAWFGAESERWPEPLFKQVARSWLRIAAQHGRPLSGGVLAAADLRTAKIEMTREFESDEGRVEPPSWHTFNARMVEDGRPRQMLDVIRRVYPITLLGPKFARQVDGAALAALAAAGATNIEQVGDSILFDATPTLLEAWSPEYLAATTELRRLLWPIVFHHPLDDPGGTPLTLIEPPPPDVAAPVQHEPEEPSPAKRRRKKKIVKLSDLF